jgi:hypothetical protein
MSTKFSVWMGGSILGELATFKTMMITGDEYHGIFFFPLLNYFLFVLTRGYLCFLEAGPTIVHRKCF